ncbi:MAG: SurA N-terminal domain-containing protein, partial [Acidobacteria bacterium]|nr:SurA N-terminal domain-containing protein [Acidobacteriota bacterium]
MLKAMRDSFQHLKWILILIVFAFVLLVFVDWGGAGRTGAVSGVGYAAKVNGETISIEDFQRSLILLERQYEDVYGQRLSDEDREAMGLQRQVLQNLVNQKLLLQSARQMNLVATPEEIRRQILALPVLNPGGQFVGAELYERYVKSALNYNSAAAFEADLADDITLNKMESAIQSSIILPDKLVEEEYRSRNESASVRYVLVPAEDLMSQVQVTPEEVEQHYRSNASNYTHPAQRRVKYLQVDQEALRSSMNVSDAELRQAYQASQSKYETARAQHILIAVPQDATPERQREALGTAEDAARRARAGEDFALLAEELPENDCPQVRVKLLSERLLAFRDSEG